MCGSHRRATTEMAVLADTHWLAGSVCAKTICVNRLRSAHSAFTHTVCAPRFTFNSSFDDSLSHTSVACCVCGGHASNSQWQRYIPLAPLLRIGVHTLVTAVKPTVGIFTSGPTTPECVYQNNGDTFAGRSVNNGTTGTTREFQLNPGPEPVTNELVLISYFKPEREGGEIPLFTEKAEKCKLIQLECRTRQWQLPLERGLLVTVGLAQRVKHVKSRGQATVKKSHFN